MRPARGHALWWAYLLHRLSGLALALFLPLHFWMLAMVLTAPDRVDAYFVLAEAPMAKFAEVGLVFLLALHALGGLRLFALEWLPWSASQKTLAAGAAAGAVCLSGLFLLQAV